jgi:hypothetical protein
MMMGRLYLGLRKKMVESSNKKARMSLKYNSTTVYLGSFGHG